MSNVRKILCHAEFFCARCHLPYTCMAVAPWDDVEGVIGEGERIGHDICNACQEAGRKAERDEYNRDQRLRRQQRAWAKKHQPIKH